MATVIHTERGAMPRSVLRHRPIGGGTQETDGTVYRTTTGQRTQDRASRLLPAKRPPQTLTKPVPGRNRPHWLLPVGAAMLLAVVLIMIGQYAWSWGRVAFDDLRYGRPRTMHMDQFVGHETGTMPSHFITTNLRGRIHIIEFPGGDASKAKLYMGPQLEGNNVDLLPAELQFVDVNHDRLVDMLVQVGNLQMTFLNEKGGFRAQ